MDENIFTTLFLIRFKRALNCPVRNEHVEVAVFGHVHIDPTKLLEKYLMFQVLVF